MRRVRILAALLTALLAPVLVTACADDEAAGTQAAAIEGVPWVLESGAGMEAGGPAPTATFEAGRVTGTTGCNRYSGTYVVDGGRLSIEPGATTLKGCPPPADEVERAYLAALGRVSGWRGPLPARGARPGAAPGRRDVRGDLRAPVGRRTTSSPGPGV